MSLLFLSEESSVFHQLSQETETSIKSSSLAQPTQRVGFLHVFGAKEMTEKKRKEKNISNDLDVHF